MKHLGLALSALIVGTAGLSLAQVPKEEPAKAQSPSPKLVPDQSFVKVEGGMTVTLWDFSPAAFDLVTYRILVKSRDANDKLGIEQMAKEKAVVLLPRGSRLLILTWRSAIGVEPANFPIEARVLEGPEKGKMIFIHADDVGRLVPARGVPVKSKAKGKQEPAPAKKVDAEAKAANLLQLGQNVQKNGNRDAAIDYYRKTIEASPESVSATKAKERLVELGVK